MKAQEENLFGDGFDSSGRERDSTGAKEFRSPRAAESKVAPRTRILLLLGLVVLLAGCGPEDFLNPLYTRKDLVSDPLLVGSWEFKDEEGTMILHFQPAGDGCYMLTITGLLADNRDGNAGGQPDSQRREFTACLTQLGQTVFLDLQPREMPLRPTTETFHLTDPRQFAGENPFSPAVFHADDGFFITLAPKPDDGAVVSSREYELRLTPAHWIFRIWIEQTTLRLSDFEPHGDVATLSTEELQKLALKYADDSSVFSSAGEWQRRTGDSQ